MALQFLVVDDSSVMRKMITKIINLTGLPVGEIMEAGNGKEGLNLIENNWIDLALVDINMPVMNGEEMIKRLRKKPNISDLPIIIVSSKSIDKNLEILIEEKTGYIHKPFTPETLRESVIEMVGHKEETIELNAQLNHVASLTLEEFCYLLPSDTTPRKKPSDKPTRAFVDFKGPFSGRLSITVYATLLRALASNILAEEKPSQKQQYDALGEVANIICGNFLSAIAGRREVFSIDAPHVIKDEEKPEGELPSAETVLSYEKGWAMLSLFLESGAASYFNKKRNE